MGSTLLGMHTMDHSHLLGTFLHVDIAMLEIHHAILQIRQQAQANWITFFHQWRCSQGRNGRVQDLTCLLQVPTVCHGAGIVQGLVGHVAVPMEFHLMVRFRRVLHLCASFHHQSLGAGLAALGDHRKAPDLQTAKCLETLRGALWEFQGDQDISAFFSEEISQVQFHGSAIFHGRLEAAVGTGESDIGSQLQRQGDILMGGGQQAS
mmetsp:Transcript_16209/g.19492  ORF Transcript_16209/g.19492 Transcript_16209/m.19492 type:complete len:207 (-) Transcript_16209:352-972(-)